MIARLLRVLCAIALALVAAPALAGDDPDFRAIKAGEPLTLRSDRAYVLLRLDTDLSKFDALILRVPEPEELAAYDAAKRKAYDEQLAKAQAKVAKNPSDKSVERLGSYDAFLFYYEGRSNLFSLRPGKSLITINKIAYVLAEVTPGDYVVYGEGYSGYIYQCFCLGTVGFTAKAGEVTDLGTMLFAKAWEPSPVPELVGEVDLGRSAVMDYGLFAVALRPAKPGETYPPGLDSATIHPAAFSAVGTFVDTNVIQINRLAAMPGVLAYQDGRVIDVPSGKEVPAH